MVMFELLNCEIFIVEKVN